MPIRFFTIISILSGLQNALAKLHGVCSSKCKDSLNSNLRQIYILPLESVTDSFAKKLAEGVHPFSHASC